MPTISRSFSNSSVSITSMSRAGSTDPSTWMMSSSVKQRTTCTIASTAWMWDRNWLPSPSPCDAPLTSPAMSTNSTVVGSLRADLPRTTSVSRRSSGTGTMPMLGSMVANG